MKDTTAIPIRDSNQNKINFKASFLIIQFIKKFHVEITRKSQNS